MWGSNTNADVKMKKNVNKQIDELRWLEFYPPIFGNGFRIKNRSVVKDNTFSNGAISDPTEKNLPNLQISHQNLNNK